jgi:hypothetical protein
MVGTQKRHVNFIRDWIQESKQQRVVFFPSTILPSCLTSGSFLTTSETVLVFKVSMKIHTYMFSLPRTLRLYWASSYCFHTALESWEQGRKSEHSAKGGQPANAAVRIVPIIPATDAVFLLEGAISWVAKYHITCRLGSREGGKLKKQHQYVRYKGGRSVLSCQFC